MVQDHFIILAFHVSMGAMLFAALLAFLAGWHGHRALVYAVFGLLCLAGTGYQYWTAHYYLASDVADAATALRMQWSFACLFLMFFFVFLGAYARFPKAVFWVSVAVTVYGSMLLINAVEPYSMRFSSLAMAEPLHLPWGETLSRFQGTPSKWHSFAAVAALGGIAWGAWITLSLYKRGDHKEALRLGIAVALLLVAGLSGSLIDQGVIDFFYVSGFAFLGMVCVMGGSLAGDLRDRNAALTQTTSELREEVAMRREAEARIRRMAYEDYVTALPNRAAAHEHLAQVMDRARREARNGALCIVDLDHFKTINDALGHDVGDEVLRRLAHRLEDAVQGDAFLARMGGDEFVLVIPPRAADRKQAEHQAQRLSRSLATLLAEPIKVGNQVLNVSASIGVATYPEVDESILDLLRHAEMALYQAKRSGRSTIRRYQTTMQARADARLEWERDLHKALERDEFELHFQPQVNHTGQMIGAEALIRWRHPEKGLVAPGEFIGVAEETGLIHPIGTWVQGQACAQLARWLESGVPFRGHLSMNSCAWEFARADFVDTLRKSVDAYSLDARRLAVEITETALLYDIEDTVNKLKELRALGLSIALDDFGTGYSSLSYLKDLPLDVLKIDRAFVSETGATSEHPLVETMISIGRHMGLQVVAEGVETAAQRDALVAMGCLRFQGYLFGKPLPERQFEEWIACNAGARP